MHLRTLFLVAISIPTLCSCNFSSKSSSNNIDVNSEPSIDSTTSDNGITSSNTSNAGDNSSYIEENTNPNHEHIFDEAYSYDKDYHYHKAICGHNAISGKAKHTFGEWTSLGVSLDGEEFIRTCSVCLMNEEKTVKIETPVVPDDESGGDEFVFDYGEAGDELSLSRAKSILLDGCDSSSYSLECVYSVNDADYIETSKISKDVHITHYETPSGNLDCIVTLDDTIITEYIYNDYFDIYEKMFQTDIKNILESIKNSTNTDTTIFSSNFTFLEDSFSSFGYNKEKGGYYAKEISFNFTYSEYNFEIIYENVLFKIKNGKLVSLFYDLNIVGFTYHYKLYDFSTTSIDTSYKKKLHEHTFDESTWSYNSSFHYHSATCEHAGEEEHILYGGPSFYMYPHSFSSDGICSTCGYKQES